MHHFRQEPDAEGIDIGVAIEDVEEVEGGGQAENDGQAQNQEPAPPQRRRDRNENWAISVDDNAFSTIMGALFFPAVSSAMGELLKVALPSRWVTRQASRATGRRSNGLLQEQWGRTIVGGCLFVVLKDVVNLYCKWRKAKSLRDRKVIDYMRRKRRSEDVQQGP